MLPALITFTLLIVLYAVVWFREYPRGTRKRGGATDNIVPLPTNRPFHYGYKPVSNGIDFITDPREMAAVLMMDVARARGGALTEAQSDTIEAEMARVFELSSAQSEDLAAHAAHITQSASRPEFVVGTLSHRIVSSGQLTREEMVELDDMLVAVSEAEGTPTRDQLSLLQIYRDHIGLKI